MYFDDSAHRISSVQCTLRTAQHINTLDVGVVEIECGFIYIRYIVNIEAYGGSIDARTDTTNVDGRCQSRTVIRNKYIPGPVLSGSLWSSLVQLACLVAKVR